MGNVWILADDVLKLPVPQGANKQYLGNTYSGRGQSCRRQCNNSVVLARGRVTSTNSGERVVGE